MTGNWGLGFVVIILAALALTSCVHLTDETGQVVELRKTELGLAAVGHEYVQAATEETLHALVKGSIYETGEQMSVFGACLNAYDQPIVDETSTPETGLLSFTFEGETPETLPAEWTELGGSGEWLIDNTSQITNVSTMRHTPIGDNRWEFLELNTATNTTNMTISATLKGTFLAQSQGLAVRLQDINNAYFCSMNGAGNRLDLIKIVGGATTTLDTYGAGQIDAGSKCDAELVVEGNQLTCTFTNCEDADYTGIKILSATDNDLTYGKAGFVNYDYIIGGARTAYYDDVSYSYVDYSNVTVANSSLTTATFSAYYPNGTQFIFDEVLPEIEPGYYLHQSNMTSVQGTYLTELTCTLGDEQAKAFGEWQNPYWVKRIELLNNSLNDLNVSIGAIDLNGTNVTVDNTEVLNAIANLSQNFTITIGNLQTNMTDSFEITWDMIESVNGTVLNINQSIQDTLIWVAGVANDSVDRNDSLIVQLLYQLLNETTYVPPINYSLTWNETPDDRVQYYVQWNIDVEVFNSNGIQVGWPLVACYINTTNSPPTVGELMDDRRNLNNEPYFSHSEKIRVLSGFNWTTWCEYN